MTSKQVLALDYDDLLAPFIVPIRKWMLEVHGYEMGDPQKPSFSMAEAYGDPPNGSWDDYNNEFISNASLRLQTPDVDAVETVKTLSEMFNLHIITSRLPAHKETTVQSIDKYFGKYIDELHLPTEKGSNPMNTDKGILCRRIGAIGLCDDADHNIEKAMKQGVQGILLKRDYHYYNGQHVPNGTLVVRSWEELKDVAKERYETGKWPIQKPSLPTSSYYSLG